MRKMFYFTGMLLSLLLMNSCAVVGTIAGITAFGVEGYEEVRVHRPDLKLEPLSNYLPDLKLSSKESSSPKNTKTNASKASAKFGFDCSTLDNEKKQSKCFDDFSKALAKRVDQAVQPKDVVTPKKEDKLTKNQKVTKTLKEASAKVAKKLSPITEDLPASFVNNWARAWEKKNISTYISFYSMNYKGTKNHRGAWEASRQHAFKNNKNISIKLSNIHTHNKGKNRVEVNFTQEYKSDGYTDTGIKELIVEKKGADWKIIKETWMPADATIKKINATDHTRQIKDKLATWLRAWENQDVNTYISLYSNKFKTPKNNRAKWRNSRLHTLKASKNISIRASNLKIDQNKNITELNFTQEFNSDKYSDVGIKELVWIKEGSDWKILKETWISS